MNKDDFNPLNCCGKCDPCNSCDPCKKGCCTPACYDCDISIVPDAFDPRFWHFTINGCTVKVRVPDGNDIETYLDFDCSAKTMTYFGENGTQVFTGKDLGCILDLEDLGNVNIAHPEACSMLVFNPGCGGCPCDPEEDTWQAYKIPEAGDCVMTPDDDGYYKVLKMNDCGCVEECRLPVIPQGMTSLNYVRDSVPDDPDFPWYYGIYNDTINLYLAQNAPDYFGKYKLKVTVNYTIQVILSDQCTNVNFRSLLCPQVEGETLVNVEEQSSILQGFSGFSTSSPEIPWGSQSMRGTLIFIVPKGKEASLHHEFRLHSVASFAAEDHYMRNPTYDGKRVPDNIASQVNALPYNASRLNALQVIIEPTFGTPNFDPVVDPERSQLDAPVDEYPIN